jgi:DNA-binding response OmpR family regulator
MINNDVSILIAEDDTQLRQLYVEYLLLFFDTVYEAEDGKQALGIYKEKAPDIIISDINMPKLDGLALIEEIRKKDQQTPIVILSAYVDQDILLQAIKLHLFEYLVKPVDSQELKELILSMIKNIHFEREYVNLSEGYKWHKYKHYLYKENSEIKLQESEKRLLEILIHNLNSNVSTETLYQYVYSDMPEKEYSTHAITSLIKRVRKKLPIDTIQTNYGNGYTFCVHKNTF